MLEHFKILLRFDPLGGPRTAADCLEILWIPTERHQKSILARINECVEVNPQIRKKAIGIPSVADDKTVGINKIPLGNL